MSRLPVLLKVLREPSCAPSLTEQEWDVLVRQAGAARLSATVQGMLEEHGVLGTVPTRARAHFEWARVHAARHRSAVHWEVRQIRTALTELALPLILLKGGAYAEAALPASQGRVFTDIDILVPEESLDAVEAALMMNGWRSMPQDDYDQRYYRNWMHELPPMQHVKRATSIDVHHAILPRTARARPDSRLLRRAAVTAAADPALQVLAPADMILHSATHLFYGEFNNSLRDLVDIHRLLLHFGTVPGFWERLPVRAAELELSRPLYYALRHTSRLLGTPVPGHVGSVCAAAAPNVLLRSFMDFLLSRALLPDHRSCATRGSGMARFALYLRANWLRMPPWLLTRHLMHKAFLSPKA